MRRSAARRLSDRHELGRLGRRLTATFPARALRGIAQRRGNKDRAPLEMARLRRALAIACPASSGTPTPQRRRHRWHRCLSNSQLWVLGQTSGGPPDAPTTHSVVHSPVLASAPSFEALMRPAASELRFRGRTRSWGHGTSSNSEPCAATFSRPKSSGRNTSGCRPTPPYMCGAFFAPHSLVGGCVKAVPGPNG